jgi:protein phosphatase
MNIAATDLHWSSASRTDVGMVRKLNEDSVLDLPELGLWAVADGMGGHSAGDFASAAIVTALSAIPRPSSLDALSSEVRRRLQTVNRRLHDEAIARREQVIGSTVVALLADANHASVLWAGDSRAYLYRDGKLLQLSRDHSQVEELMSRGLLTPEQAEGHPASNVITRAVGVVDTVEVDSETLAIAEDDIFLLCSDGLYRELDDDAIKACLLSGDCRRACDELVNAALAQGARDNVSVVVVRIADGTQVTRTQYNPSVKPVTRSGPDPDDPTDVC